MSPKYINHCLVSKSLLVILTIAVIAGFGNSVDMIDEQYQGRSILKHAKEFYYSTARTALPPPGEIAPHGVRSYYDRPDDSPGKYQIHVLYVVPEGFEYPIRDFDGSIDEQISLVNEWFASQTDGAILRFDTYQGNLDITFVELQINESELYSYLHEKYGMYDGRFDGIIFLHNGLEDWLETTNRTQPIFSAGKIYLTYFDTSFAYVCGDGPAVDSRIIGIFPSAYNLRDNNECKAFLGNLGDNKRGAWEHVLAHEIIHALGFPASCAKNLDSDNVHINDPSAPEDIMGTNLGIYAPNPTLDPNHDDYYLTNIPGCPDLADSPFLEPSSPSATLPESVLSKSEWRLP